MTISIKFRLHEWTLQILLLFLYSQRIYFHRAKKTGSRRSWAVETTTIERKGWPYATKKARISSVPASNGSSENAGTGTRDASQTRACETSNLRPSNYFSTILLKSVCLWFQYYMQQGLAQPYFQPQQFYQPAMPMQVSHYPPFGHPTNLFQYPSSNEQSGNNNVMQNLGMMPSQQGLVYGPVMQGVVTQQSTSAASGAPPMANANQVPAAYLTSTYNNNRTDGLYDLSMMSLTLPNVEQGFPQAPERPPQPSETGPAQQLSKANSYQQELIALDLWAASPNLHSSLSERKPF